MEAGLPQLPSCSYFVFLVLHRHNRPGTFSAFCDEFSFLLGSIISTFSNRFAIGGDFDFCICVPHVSSQCKNFLSLVDS